MRNAFAKAMSKLAQERDDICLLSGDIGNRMFDEYKEVAPTRFINCGIAEANMMSMATGMALNGIRPVVYTITPFTTTRCLEQFRTGVAYQHAPVVIVGTGSGLSYAELGATHHSLEDLAIMRSIPNMQVCAPADSLELIAQLREAIDVAKPTYIRIGKKGEPNLFKKEDSLGIGKANLLKDGKGILLVGVGPILSEAIKARSVLKKENIHLGIASMGGVKPIDYKFLKQCVAAGYNQWISLEEHHRNGGLGSAILEWLSEKNIKTVELKRLGIGDHFVHKLGTQEYVRDIEGVNEKAIINLVRSL